MSIEVKPVAIVLADISGYTRFIKYHAMAVMHAEQIITDLIEAVIDSAEFPLAVSKLEGDAVFFYAVSRGDEAALARDVAKQVLKFFEVFQAKASALRNSPICICEACRNVDQLRLKAILHHGTAAFKRVKHFEELAGEDVILAHRLMKNSIPSKEYILMTEAFYRLAGELGGYAPESRTEKYEDVGDVPVTVYYPGGKDAQPEPSHASFVARLWQYARVNMHGVLRFLRLRPRQNYLHLPD